MRNINSFLMWACFAFMLFVCLGSLFSCRSVKTSIDRSKTEVKKEAEFSGSGSLQLSDKSTLDSLTSEHNWTVEVEEWFSDSNRNQPTHRKTTISNSSKQTQKSEKKDVKQEANSSFQAKTSSDSTNTQKSGTRHVAGTSFGQTFWIVGGLVLIVIGIAWLIINNLKNRAKKEALGSI